MNEKWVAKFAPYVQEEEDDPNLEISFVFETKEAEDAYYEKQRTQPNAFNELVTDLFLTENNAAPTRSVVFRGEYPRTMEGWTPEAALAEAIPDDLEERFHWDPALVVPGLFCEWPRPLPDIYGVGFTDEELEQWSDTNSRQAVVEAYAAADDEQSSLLNAMGAL